MNGSVPTGSGVSLTKKEERQMRDAQEFELDALIGTDEESDRDEAGEAR